MTNKIKKIKYLKLSSNRKIGSHIGVWYLIVFKLIFHIANFSIHPTVGLSLIKEGKL